MIHVGTPVTRVTTSPSNWYAMFEYFCCGVGDARADLADPLQVGRDQAR
jgi:hypothetical protein